MPASWLGRLNSSTAWRCFTGVVLAALLLLCFLALRKPGGTATRPAGALPAVGAVQGTDTIADQQRRKEIARLGPIERHGVNGANLYANAMALYSQLSEADQQALQDWDNEWIDGPKWSTDPALRANAAFFGRIQPILSLLRQARNADYVDWGIDPANRYGMSEPWVLGRVGLWGAAYQFQADPQSAVADLAAVQALGRNISSNVGGLFDGSILASQVFTMLSQNAPLLPGVATADLNYLLDPTAAMQRVQNAMNGDVEADQEMIAQYTNPAAQNGSAVATMAAKGSVDPGTVLARLQWEKMAEEAFAQNLSEPPAQIQQLLDQIRADPAYPKGEGLGLGGIWSSMQNEMVQAAMVEAGIALEEGDQGLFQSIKDPTTGAPFTYTQSDDGFQLASSLPSINDPTVNETNITFNPATPDRKPVVRKITNVKVGGETETLAFPWAVPGN